MSEPVSESLLLSRLCLCPDCRGRGSLPAVQCALCGFRERVSRAAGLPSAVAAWHGLDTLTGDTLPCGHGLVNKSGEPRLWAWTRGDVDCPRCFGSGRVPVWKTAAAWAKQDVKDALAKKQQNSDAAKALSECGAGGGYSAKTLRRLVQVLRPVCEAYSRRTGQPCRNKAVLGAVRCAQHGGKSRGPTTAAGRARISESNRRRSECRKDGLGVKENADVE